MRWPIVMALLGALVGAAPAEPAQPDADAALRILNYVPPDVDCAILVRMDALAASDLWQRLKGNTCLYDEIVREFDLALDVEKDISAGVFCLQILYQEDGNPDDAAMGAVLALNRDIQPQTLFKDTDNPQFVQMPGVSLPVYSTSRGGLAVLPDARTVVLASKAYLAPMLTAATTLYGTPPWPQRELAVPGEITFAGRMPEKLKAAIRTEWDQERSRLLKPNADPERVLEFAFFYNLVALALDAETATGSLNLADEAAALRATLMLGEGRLAVTAASAAQALADPLAMALPALFGGAPLAEPPAEPLYLVQADGREIRVTMSRPALEQLVGWMAAGAGGGDAHLSSAMNLHEIGRAVQGYRADHGGEYPPTLAAIGAYVADAGLFLNPARTEHFPGGDYQLVPLSKAAAAKQPWAKVLAYEIFPPDQAPPAGVYVLFADGHVEYVAVAEFDRLYQQTLQSLGR